MICSYSLAKDIIPNVALMIHIKAVVLQEAPGFGEVKTFPLKQQASENDDLTVQRNSLETKIIDTKKQNNRHKSKIIDTKSNIIDTKKKILDTKSKIINPIRKIIDTKKKQKIDTKAK